MTKENIITKDVAVSVNIDNAKKAVKIAGFPTKSLTDTQIFDKVLGMLGLYGGSATTKTTEEHGEGKKFDELNKGCSFDKITLERKSVIKESTPRKDKLFEEMLYYKVGNETTTMYAYIDDKGRASAYNEDNDCYRSSTGYYKIRIPEPVLNKLISLALHQVVEDYKLSLVAKDYKSFLNENQKAEEN